MPPHTLTLFSICAIALTTGVATASHFFTSESPTLDVTAVIDPADPVYAAAVATPTDPCTGFSIQIALSQCKPGDTLTLGTTGPFTATAYDTTYCLITAAAVATQQVSDCDASLLSVTFSSTNTERTQLTFGWVMWPQSSYDAAIYDVESSSVYLRMVPGSARTPSAIRSDCLSKSMTAPRLLKRVQSQVFTYYNADELVIDFERNTGSSVLTYSWPAGVTGTYNWGTYPVGASTDCATTIAGTGAWQDADCTNASFSMTVCEDSGSAVASSGTISYTPTSALPGFVQKRFLAVSPVFTTTVAPPATTYGATVQLPVSDCRSGDLFVFSTVVSDKILEISQSQCTLLLGGADTGANYQTQLLAIDFFVTAPISSRQSFAFSYIYWNDASFDRITYVPASNIQLTTIYSARYTPAGTYVQESAASVCALFNGGIIAEPTSAAVQEQLARHVAITVPSGTSPYIGIVRDVGFFRLATTGATAITYSKWDAASPSAINDCVTVNAAQGYAWTTAACNSTRPVVCQTAASYYGTQSRTLAGAFAPNVATPTEIRKLPVFGDVTVFRDADINIIANAATIYGVTIQQELAQCVTGDSFVVGTLPAGLTTNVASTTVCANYIGGGSTTTDLTKPFLKTVTFTTSSSEPRWQLTFRYILWTEASFVNLLSYNGKTFGIQIGAVASKAAAAGNCVAKSFTLPAVNSYPEAIAFKSVLGTYKAYLGLSRPTGTSLQFKWDDGTPTAVYNNWLTGKPSSTTNECSQADGANPFGEWIDATCVTAATATVCQSTAFTQQAATSFIQSGDVWETSQYIKNFASGNLPADSGTTIYGATIHVDDSALDCDDSDFLSPTTNNFKIVMAPRQNSTKCVWYFYGTATVTEYNQFLSTMQWRSTIATPVRSTIAFHYVYWTKPYAEHLLRYPSTGNVMMGLRNPTFGDVPTAYPWNNHTAVCNAFDMVPASLVSAIETQWLDNVRWGTQHMLIGAWRKGSTVPWFWSTGEPWSYNNFGTAPGTNLAFSCAYSHGVTGRWTSIGQCASLRIDTVACKSFSWGSYAGTFTATVATKAAWTGAALLPFEKSFHVAGVLQTVRGLAVSVALAQCLPADQLSSTVSVLAGQAATYSAAYCTITVTGTDAPSPITKYADVLGGIQFTSTDTWSRPAISFSWMMWTDANINSAYYDVETRHAYVTLPASPAVSTKAEIATRCTSVSGGTFKLPTVTTRREAFIVGKNKAAAGVILDASQLPAGFAWSSGEKMTHQNWRIGAPDVSGALLCALIRGSDDQWEDADCATASYTVAHCEAADVLLAGTTIFAAAPSLIATPFNVYMPFNLSALPVTPLATVYGATAMTNAAACRESDDWIPKRLNDRIAVIRADDCVIMLAGPQSNKNYADVVAGLEWHSVSRLTAAVTWGWILWTDESIKEMVIDTASGKVYTAVPSSVVHIVPGGLGFPAAPNYCATLGWNNVAVTSTAVLRVVEQVGTQYSTYLSATRTANGGVFTWQPSATAVGVTDFQFRQPLTDTDWCLQRDVGGGWATLDCTAWARSILCEQSPWTASGTKTFTFQPEAAPTLTTFHALTFNGAYQMISAPLAVQATTELSKIGATVFGATVQVPITQCRKGDVLTATSLSGATQSYDPTTCSLTITGTMAASAYRSVLESVAFSTDVNGTRRQEIAFGWMLHTSSNITNMMMDHEMRSVYTFRTVSAAVSPVEAAQQCRLFGPGWTLAVPQSKRVNQLLSKQSIPVAIGSDSTTRFRYWVNGAFTDTRTFINWGTAQPSGAGECVGVALGTGAWSDVSCTAQAFTTFACQNSAWTLSTVTTWRMNFLSGVASLNSALNGLLPASSATTVYGGTAQVPLSQCFDYDTYYATASGSHEYIHMIRRSCGAMFAGLADVTSYNYVFSALRFTSFSITHDSNLLPYGFVYWTTPEMREVTMDFATNRGYTVVPATVSWNIANGYQASTLCPSSWRIAELANAESQSGIVKVQTADVYIGAKRPAAASPFQWFTSTNPLTPFSDWLSNQPSTTTLLCAKQAVSGTWSDVDCATRLTQVACEQTAPTYINWATKAMTFPWDMLGSNTDSISFHGVTGDLQKPVFSSTWVSWFSGSFGGFYGFSAQIHQQQCFTSDLLYFGVTPSWLGTSTYNNAICLLDVAATSERDLSDFSASLPDLKMKQANLPTVQRMQITATVILWTDARMTTAWVDAETQKVLTRFDAPSSISWDAAYQRCTDFGYGWSLATATKQIQLNVMGQQGTGSVPIRHRRAASSYFGVWERASTVTKSYFWSWNTGFPTATGDCVRVNNGKMENVDCTTNSFTTVVCEKPTYTFAMSTSFYLTQPNNLAKSASTAVPDGHPTDVSGDRLWRERRAAGHGVRLRRSFHLHPR
jgi:hypothetical protein